jgi:hypothetical protein
MYVCYDIFVQEFFSCLVLTFYLLISLQAYELSIMAAADALCTISRFSSSVVFRRYIVLN